MGRKVVFVWGICDLFRKYAKLTQVCAQRLLSSLKTEIFLPLLVRALFFIEPPRKSAWAKTEMTSISNRQSCRKYHSLVTIRTRRNRWYRWSVMQTRMAALNFRIVIFYHSLSWQMMAGVYCMFKWNFYVREYENLGQSFKNWRLWKRLWMNRISQYLDVAWLTGARSENIPDQETVLKEQSF